MNKKEKILSKNLHKNQIPQALDFYNNLWRLILFGTVIGTLSSVMHYFLQDKLDHADMVYFLSAPLNGFLVGSLVLFLEKQPIKAIFFGAFLSGIIILNSHLSQLLHITAITGVYISYLLTMIFFFIHGWKRGNFKSGIFAMLGSLISFFITSLISIGADEIGNALSVKIITIMPGIFNTAITWYIVLVFESIGYKETHKKVFRRLFEVSHRVDLKNYVGAYLYAFVPSFFMGYAIGLSSDDKTEFLITAFIPALLFIPSFFQAIKRLHDVEKSGWWILVPIWNIYLVLFKKGTSKENKYGLPLYAD